MRSRLDDRIIGMELMTRHARRANCLAGSRLLVWRYDIMPINDWELEDFVVQVVVC